MAYRLGRPPAMNLHSFAVGNVRVGPDGARGEVGEAEEEVGGAAGGFGCAFAGWVLA